MNVKGCPFASTVRENHNAENVRGPLIVDMAESSMIVLNVVEIEFAENMDVYSEIAESVQST